MAILLGDFGSLIPAAIHSCLLYLISKNHRYTIQAIFLWAILYLLTLTGIKAAGKTLVILGGNGWEINTFRYSIDLFLVFLGTLIAIFHKKMIQFEEAG